MNGTCHLCQKHEVLRESHIIPKFLHKDLKNEKSQLLGIHGRGSTGAKLLQDGLKEHLLCERCEQHLNENFEKPFKRRWVDEDAIGGTWLANERRTIQVDYASFKLFHLSIFFRADACSLRTYSNVDLGEKNRRRLRWMLLECEPGRPNEFPIKAAVVLHNQRSLPVQIVSQGEQFKVQGHIFYGMMYGGAYWCLRPSSNPFPGIDEDHLLGNGDLPLVAKDWREFPLVTLAGMALRGEVSL